MAVIKKERRSKAEVCEENQNLSIPSGTVYWVTGLSGAGKTTVAKALYEKMKVTKPAIVLLDGDDLRKSVAEDLGYERNDRIEAAMRYAKMSEMLARQGLTVIISTISMFHCVREWSRNNIAGYVEIYLKVPLSVLKERNQKNLYSGTGDGKIKNVIGVDMEIEEPKNPHIIIANDGRFTIKECIEKIADLKVVGEG